MPAAAASVSCCMDVQTEVIRLTPDELHRGAASYFGQQQGVLHPSIARAAAALAAGEVVAIPTETVYGLAANALSAPAVCRVYAAKNRPPDNPLIVHVSSLAMLASLYPPGWALPPIYEAPLRDLWPGPLTVLLPCSPFVPDVVTCGQPTMAVRMPSHPVALALIAACGFPLAAPSANSSGRPSPTIARHVLTDLGGRVPLILDGGPCTCGVESTVLDGLRQPPAVLRPGGVTREQLTRYPGLGELLLYRRDFIDPQLEAAPSTPGMKYRHYSPTAQVLLLDPGDVSPPVPVAGTGGSGVSDEELAARLQRGAEALLAEELALVRGRAAGAAAQGAEQRRPAAGCSDGGGAAARPAASAVLPRVGVLRTSLGGLRPGPLLRQQAPTALAGGAFGNAGGKGASQSDGPSESLHAASAGHSNGAAEPGSARMDAGGVAREECRGGVQSAVGAAEEEEQPGAVAEPLPYYEYVLGHLSRPAEVASELFAALRHMDEVGVEVIVVEGLRDAGAGVAVMNRLRKAASRVVAV